MMNNMQKKCESCGDPIIGSKRRFCDKCKKRRARECAKIHYKNKIEEAQKRSKNQSLGLDYDANAATAAGLTYGQYMGRLGKENLWENRMMHSYRR